MQEEDAHRIADATLGSRRKIIAGLMSGLLVVAGGAVMSRDAYADALTRTPEVTEGPFYPRKYPLDTDNDLIVVNNGITPALGEIAHLSGRILDVEGNPVAGAQVEIWQVDAKGVYLEQRNRGTENGDVHFQGFGRCLTGPSGEYYFRTLKPVPYIGRTAPHIHVGVRRKGVAM